jgi:fido (protein-threonine AMPylation protein)
MNELSVSGIDGQHLWGFLAALGTLSLLDEHARENSLDPPRLAFKADGTAVLQSPVAGEQLAAVLLSRLNALKPKIDGDFAGINKPSDLTRSSYEKTALASSGTTLDLLAGLACVVGEETFESTLCAANGASHQNLVQSMRDVLNLVEEEQLRVALFEPWKKSYRVPEDKRRQLGLGSRKPTLRLDPADERLYALRLSNPTTADDFSTEVGAQALAIPAYGLLPVVPRRPPVTVASKRSRQRVSFSWMLWSVPASLRTVRSLVWEGVGRLVVQRHRGVFAAFSADRVSGAKGKLSFTPSQGLWWATQPSVNGLFVVPETPDNPPHDPQDGLESRDPRLAPTAAGRTGGAAPRPRGGPDLAEHGVRAREGGPGLAEGPARGATEPTDATRHVDTAEGRLNYSELAQQLAGSLLRIDDRIRHGEFADRPMDADLLLAFHAALCAQLFPQQAGRYRSTAVQVGAHQPPPAHQVAERVLEYTRNLDARLQHLPAEPDDRWLETLAYAEGELLSIHPFPDLNGRISRLWLSELMRRMGLPPVDIVPSDSGFRQRYLDALASADRRDWSPLQTLWQERLESAGEQP